MCWLVEEDKIEDDKVEEGKIEEDKVEEDKVEEDNVEEDKIEEDKGKEQEETPSGMHAKSRALGTVDFFLKVRLCSFWSLDAYIFFDWGWGCFSEWKSSKA